MADTGYKTVLVTGASSGIGAACTHAFCRRGMHVIAAARRQDKLDALAEATGCEPLVLDVRDKAAIYGDLAGREIDVLINNAGLALGMGDRFLESPPDDIDTMIGINVIAALHMVRALAPGMIERGRGHIVQIGSLAGVHAVGLPGYGASKGATHMFGRHLRMELAGGPVRYTEINPGRTATEIFEAGFRKDDKRAAFNAGIDMLQPDDVAAAILYAVGAPPHVNVSVIELTPVDQAPGGAVLARKE